MMTSRVLSRLLPVAEGDVSVFEGMRSAHHRQADVEAQARNEGSFHDEDEFPDRIFLEGTNDGASEQTAPSPDIRQSAQQSPVLERIRPKWLDSRRNRRIDEDDDVPESLILDSKGKMPESRETSSQASPLETRARAEAQWKTTQEKQALHAGHQPRTGASGPSLANPHTQGMVADPQVDAMWMYTSAGNLDAFLLEVYQYFVYHGVWSILLSRALTLLRELFVFSFALFLTTCVDYSKIPGSKKSADVVVPQCLQKAHWIKSAALFVFIIYWLSTLTQYFRDVRRLFHMQRFYLHILSITDTDIQTVSWVRVVEGLVKAQDANIATMQLSSKMKQFLNYSKPQQRINAETIANRLMRQDNYYVALYNKEILDFTLPLPFVGSRQFYSKSLEWCIDFCLTNFIFDEQGSIRPFCLEVKNRRALVTALRRRLQFAALTSVLIAPFNIIRFCMLYFFTYYTEFTKNPAQLSARSFTPFAEWKIREFNELEHLFQRRLAQATPFANEYLKQFPKDKQDQFCRFVALVSGALAAVLGILTIWDSELALGFEVTPGRTALFWLTALLGIFTVARGALPDENEAHDPVLHLREVLMYTRHMPAHWKDRLHSNEVRSEFSAMYQMKILIFVEEILSLIVAPWILLRNANSRCERIVDFFREVTVHVDGVGFQCNFAVFGFKKDPNAEDPTLVLHEPDGLRDDYYGLKDDKMAASVQNFMQIYSHVHQRPGHRRTHHGFQPPPAWPSILSQDLHGEERDMAGPLSRSSRYNPGTARRQRSPLAYRSPPQVAARSQTVRDRRAGVERSEYASAGKVEGGISESIMAQDSDLQDADIGGRMADDTLESDEEDEGGNAAVKNAGVLGMIYQYGRAQTERAGVSI